MPALKYKVELNETSRTHHIETIRLVMDNLNTHKLGSSQPKPGASQAPEVSALERERNQAVATIDWCFSTQDARSNSITFKLKRH